MNKNLKDKLEKAEKKNENSDVTSKPDYSKKLEKHKAELKTKIWIRTLKVLKELQDQIENL